MGKELYTNIPSKVGDLISDVKNGRIGLPDLQRPFVWKDNKVRDLLDSMLRGFPIGYIMLWESPAYYDRTSHIGKNDKAYKAPDDLVIDGQQRLTALLAAMTKVGPGAQVKSMGGQVSEQVGEQDREQVGEQDEWIVRLSSMTKMDIGPLKKLLEFCKQPRSRAEMQEFCNVKSRSYFLINILKPLIAENVLLMTLPDKPNSRLQKYCLSESFGK